MKYVVSGSSKVAQQYYPDNPSNVLTHTIEVDSLSEARVYAKALASMVSTLNHNVSEILEIYIMYACEEENVEYDSDSEAENRIRNRIFNEDMIYEIKQLPKYSYQ